MPFDVPHVYLESQYSSPHELHKASWGTTCTTPKYPQLEMHPFRSLYMTLSLLLMRSIEVHGSVSLSAVHSQSLR